jgi:cyanophycinase
MANLSHTVQRSPINRLGRLLILMLALLFIMMAFLASPAQAKVKDYLTGNSADVNPTLAGPAYDLGGGGTDVDDAIQWLIDQVRGCTDCNTKIDFVVLRFDDSDGYKELLPKIKGLDSIETFVITSRKDANNPDVVNKVKNAEIIFFAGGDQCEYVRNFRNTGIENAVESVHARGGGIGGTSAGSMILGDYIYSACGDAVVSRDALDDPYKDISFTYDFFSWPTMKGTIVDTHFDKRDRMGRLMTFVARQIRDGESPSTLGIGINEQTSVVVNKTGRARVMGNASAYLILADRDPEVCEPGKPLTFSDYKIWKMDSGDTFDLNNRSQTGSYLRSVKNGEPDSNLYASN